jgi:hypothetical protein|nr:MAG TPA: hypothetical protein [Caudoviricetes sp.]
MSLINIAKVIRTAIMAKDVRENIAKGFEEANSSINEVDGKIGNKDSELDNWMSNRNTEFENWKNATNENIDYRLNIQNMNIVSNAEKIESVETSINEARTAETGATYPTLKKRLDSMKTMFPKDATFLQDLTQNKDFWMFFLKNMSEDFRSTVCNNLGFHACFQVGGSAIDSKYYIYFQDWSVHGKYRLNENKKDIELDLTTLKNKMLSIKIQGDIILSNSYKPDECIVKMDVVKPNGDSFSMPIDLFRFPEIAYNGEDTDNIRYPINAEYILDIGYAAKSIDSCTLQFYMTNKTAGFVSVSSWSDCKIVITEIGRD